MGIESFQTTPLQNIIPSYLYQEYADDENLQAFVASHNALAQGYLDWFNDTPLGVYVAPSIGGPLLDWIGAGIYDMPRPVLSSGYSRLLSGYNTGVIDEGVYNEGTLQQVSTASMQTTDDLYKRILTWNLYRGDGQVFCLQWLKNRIARFINGANGTDCAVLEFQPEIDVAGSVFTVSYLSSTAFSALQLAYANGVLAFPFQYTMTFIVIAFVNDGGVLQLTAPFDYPISPSGLAAGAIWYNGGTLSVIPGITPDPTAPPLYFASITPQNLLSTGGGNLPLVDPANNGQLWNNGGMITISAG